MNQQLLLNIYEKIEALVSRLPGPLQSAVLNELRPIKQIFIAQRPARIALLGQAPANASALLSALLGTELRLIEPNQSSGWVSYEQKGKGGFRVLDARQRNQSSRSWADLTNVLAEEAPDLCLFLVDGNKPGDLAANSEDLQVCPQRCPSYHQAVHSCLHTDKRLPKQRWMRVACQNRCSNG